MTTATVRTRVFEEIKQGHRHRAFKDFTENKNHTYAFPHKYKYALTEEKEKTIMPGKQNQAQEVQIADVHCQVLQSLEPKIETISFLC